MFTKDVIKCKKWQKVLISTSVVLVLVGCSVLYRCIKK